MSRTKSNLKKNPKKNKTEKKQVRISSKSPDKLYIPTRAELKEESDQAMETNRQMRQNAELQRISEMGNARNVLRENRDHLTSTLTRPALLEEDIIVIKRGVPVARKHVEYAVQVSAQPQGRMSGMMQAFTNMFSRSSDKEKRNAKAKTHKKGGRRRK
jgi:hypothetical protein